MDSDGGEMKLTQLQRLQKELELFGLLRVIRTYDRRGDYDRRNACTFQALSCAFALGYPCGVGFDEKEPEWPVVYIDLPEAGQVSWHTPGYKGTYDGHTTEEKYDRIYKYIYPGSSETWLDSEKP